MRSFTLVMAIAFIVVSCSPDAEVVGSTNKCANDLYPSYNPKARDQCVDACIKCDNGTTATCSTSCMFKGAR
jgi:hypothetical protein